MAGQITIQKSPSPPTRHVSRLEKFQQTQESGTAPIVEQRCEECARRSTQRGISVNAVDSDVGPADPLVNGLASLFKVDVLSQLVDLDKTLSTMKSAFLNRNFEQFKAIFPGAGQFYNLMQVTEEGIILIDNRIAVPESLRSAVLNHLHRNHPGQLAMIDAAVTFGGLRCTEQ